MSKTVITVWVPDLTFPGWMERWHGFGDEFNKRHPDYQVVIEGKNFWTFPLEVAAAAQRGQQPALAELYFYLGQVARDMRAQDDSPLFTSVERAIGSRTRILGEPVVLDDVVGAFREYHTHHGDLMSMPSVGTTSLIYGNADILEAAGVSELPRTWNEVTRACEAVARMNGGPEHAITWSNHGTFFQQMLATQGGLLVDNDNGRSGRARTADLASKEMLRWAEWWRELHRDGHYLHTGGIPDWAPTMQAFADGQVAMRISSSNDVNYMVRAAEANGFTMTAGICPFTDDVAYTGNAVAGTSLWLTNGLDKSEEDGALAFLQFLHNPENAAQRHKDNSFAPITNAAFDLLEREGWFEQHPHHRVTSDHLSTYPEGARRPDSAPATPVSQGAVFGDFAGNQNVMTHAMRDVLDGADPADRFARATEEAQRLLDAYNAYAIETGFRNPDDSPNSSLNVEYFTTAMAGRDYSAADLEKVVNR